MAQVVREKEMAVPREALFRAITEFEAYPEFLTEVVAAKPKPGSLPDKKVVTFELEVMKRFEYTLEFHLQGQNEISWRLVDSNFFKKNDGKWVLSPVDDRRTQVRYELELAFGFFVPGWVAKKLTEVNLPKMFDSFETRAKQLSEGVN